MARLTGSRPAEALKQLLEQNRVVRKVFGHGNHALDYTESGDESGRQKTVGQPPNVVA